MDNGKSHDNPHHRPNTAGITGTVEDEKPRDEPRCPPTGTGSSAAMGRKTSPIHAILTKARSARRSGKKSVAAPTLQFESDDSGSEGDREERDLQEMDRILEEKRGRFQQNSQKRPGQYVYPSDRFMNGPAEQEPRLPGEDPAADELFEYKRKAGQAGPAGVGLNASAHHE